MGEPVDKLEMIRALELWGRDDLTDHADSDTTVRRHLCRDAACALIAARQRISDLEAQCARVQETYQELLFAVGKKYTGETRHQTALRYIRAAEVSGDAAMAAKGDDWLTKEARQIGLHSPACASVRFGQNECDCGAAMAPKGAE